MFQYDLRKEQFLVALLHHAAQKMKFSIKDFFSKRDQIRSFLRIWSHLMKKLFLKNSFIVKCQLICQNF